ncbi:transcriptional regulator domain-containing protein [Nitrospirillum amazonense]|uniref:transcriptional regulator domain-containing protein n=1 Tax=Nitrospirillum amazonense TaxID=28077 RepID=UPI003CCC53E0
MRPFKRERLDADYRYIEGLDDDGLAWEFLRRSAAYQADHKAERAEPATVIPFDRGARWGLRSPGRPRPDSPGSVRVLARRRSGSSGAVDPGPPGRRVLDPL